MKIFCQDLPKFQIPKTLFKKFPTEKLQIFLAHSENIHQAKLNKFHAILSEEEQTKAAKFYFEKDRKMYILAHSLKRKILSQKTNIVPEKLRFSKNEFGKPYLENHSMGFNISHSSGYVALIINNLGDFEIGIDIEFDRQFSDYQLIIENFFNQQEQEAIHSTQDFLKLWTRKEVVLKALGVGLINELQTIQTSGFENVCFPVSAKMEGFSNTEIFIKSISLENGWLSFGGTKDLEDFEVYEVEF